MLHFQHSFITNIMIFCFLPDIVVVTVVVRNVLLAASEYIQKNNLGQKGVYRQVQVGKTKSPALVFIFFFLGQNRCLCIKISFSQNHCKNNINFRYFCSFAMQTYCTRIYVSKNWVQRYRFSFSTFNSRFQALYSKVVKLKRDHVTDFSLWEMFHNN